MKLLDRTGRYFLGFSIGLLLLSALVLFGALSFILNEELDESLRNLREVIHSELENKDTIPLAFISIEGLVEMKKLPNTETYAFYRDTTRLIFDEEDGIAEAEPFRQYIYTAVVRGQNYRFTLERLKVESEDLMLTIGGVFLGLMILLLLLMNLFNRHLSKRLWEPFYYTVDQIRNFSVAKGGRIGHLSTDIDEFRILATAIDKTTQQLTQEYQSLKTFSENASHELQTPLAIIQAKTELLLQQVNLDEQTAEHLLQLQLASMRLSRLSESLLLLVQIENQQFGRLQNIDVTGVVRAQLKSREPIIQHKSLKVSLSLRPLKLYANTDLVDIMLRNLLGNAIKHSLKGGTIVVETTPHQFLIRNTGNPPKLSGDEVFERFKKGSNDHQSLGLGLAIVKEICHLYRWDIRYEYQEGWHTVKVETNLLYGLK